MRNVWAFMLIFSHTYGQRGVTITRGMCESCGVFLFFFREVTLFSSARILACVTIRTRGRFQHFKVQGDSLKAVCGGMFAGVYKL